MRKNCAQPEDSSRKIMPVYSPIAVSSIFMLILFTWLPSSSSQLGGFFAHVSLGLYSEVVSVFSTVSTAITTITTYYLNNSLTTHRGIN